MARIVQKNGERGSLKWLQRAIAENWVGLNAPIVAQIPNAASIEWLSPLENDAFAEYRDGAFLERLGLAHLVADLNEFWPRRGPQWDALGRTDNGALLLVEAKAHVKELCSSATAAGPESRGRIETRLQSVAGELHAAAGRADWSVVFYQLANRMAHLSFLRSRNQPAFLVLVNFLNDYEMNGPTSRETWQAAYQVARYAMGLPERHALGRYIIHVYPDVSAEKG